MAIAYMLLSLAAFSVVALADDDMQICWRNSYGRGVGTVPEHCSDGFELNGLLCYPLCKDGYYGVGPVCWEKCPDGWTDIGALCTKGSQVIAKKSYGRGVGSSPSCDPALEEDAGLCYPQCKPYFVGDGPVCWQNSSGDANFTVQCNPVAFGVTEGDCKELRDLMKEAGITSALCIGALAASIISGHAVGPQQCKKHIEDILPKLLNTHACQ